jgi:hypothetical protein
MANTEKGVQLTERQSRFLQWRADSEEGKQRDTVDIGLKSGKRLRGITVFNSQDIPSPYTQEIGDASHIHYIARPDLKGWKMRTIKEPHPRVLAGATITLEQAREAARAVKAERRKGRNKT